MSLKLLLFICVISTITLSQTKHQFPIDTVDITGNFGEIRNNHFHQGIDFSTKGQENYPIKSIDKGYVYRIKISSTGYGKALYIHHPSSGFLSVFAHLNRFSDKIQSQVDVYQIQNQTNELDIFLPKDSIKIEKNEIIGFSGNTGSSTGPHLHFEIRNELTEIPVNPVFYFDIEDTTKPVLEKIIFYNLSDTISPQPHNLSVLKYDNTDTILIPPITGVAFSGFDKMYPNANPNNIYKVQLYLDNKKIYQHCLHYITFDNTIYVEYFSEKIKKQIFQKCFAPHLYPPNFYDTLYNKGRIILSDTNYHLLTLNLCDEKNNCTTKSFYIKPIHQNKTYKTINKKKLLLCTERIHIKTPYFKILIPEKALFNDLKEKIYYNKDKKRIEYTGPPISLRYPAKLTIYHQLSRHDICKAVLASSRKYYTPEIFDNKQIVFSVKELNDFYLYIDKTLPSVKPLSYDRKKKKIILPATQNKIYFKIKDNTNIKDYTVYFNNQFCQSYYNAKKQLLEVKLPEEYIASDNNTIQIKVSDIVNNTTIKTYSIY